MKKGFWILSIFFLGLLVGSILWEVLRAHSLTRELFREVRLQSATRKNQGIRTDIDWPGYPNDSLLVMFTFGQSNAANYGQEKYSCKNEVYQFFEGKFFLAADPLLGANNIRGSVWGRLSDLLIEQQYAHRILIVPVAVGNTKVSQWAKGGEYHSRLEETLESLKEQHIEIDLVCCHLGESDNKANTTKEEYIKDFNTILELFRDSGTDAPFFLAIASYQPGLNALKNKSAGCDTTIQNAQIKLIRDHEQVYPGANTDKLVQAFHRFDGVHFSGPGLQEHARLWLNAIMQSEHSSEGVGLRE